MTTSFTHADSSADRAIKALTSAGFGLGRRSKVTRTVLDTFDGRLAAAGLRLELRDGPTRELVLTGATTPPAHVAWDGEPPRLLDDLPPGPFGARIASKIEERALLSMFELSSSTRAADRRDRRGKPVVTVIVHDHLVSPSAPRAELPAWVIEIVPVAGHPADAERAVAALEKVRLDRQERDIVGVALDATGVSISGRSSSPSVPLDPSDDALTAFRAVLRNLAATMNANVPGTIDDLDPEFLHELRVAIRRTRSVLAQGKGVLPDDVRDHFRQQFADLGTATGRTRDLDVYVMGWRDMVAPLQLDDPSVTEPIEAELNARRRKAHRALCRVLKTKKTQAIFDEWSAWLDDDRAPDDEAPHDGPASEAEAGNAASSDGRSIGPFVAKRIAKAQATVLEHGRAITPDSPADDLHDLRKDAKKLRYLLECFGTIFPTKARKAFVSQLKALQENLGQHQDAEVQLHELRELAHDLHERTTIDTDALLVVGRLIDSIDRRRQFERDDFVERFAAYDTSANRQTLDALLALVAGR